MIVISRTHRNYILHFRFHEKSSLLRYSADKFVYKQTRQNKLETVLINFVNMAKVFYSEYHFVERCVELKSFARHRTAKPRYQKIIGEIVSIDYDVDIDWNNLSSEASEEKSEWHMILQF